MTPKYGIGDKVRIVNYGSLFWENKNTSDPKLSFPIVHEDENMIWKDMLPELVGQQGIVSKVTETQGIYNYTIEGIKGKYAWYQEGQMEMVNKNPNNQ